MKSIRKNSRKWYFLTANVVLILFLVFFTAPIPGNADVVFDYTKSVHNVYGEVNAVALDSSGNIYSTGNFQGGVGDFDPGAAVYNLTPTGSTADVFISKLNSSGEFIWAKKVGGLVGNEGARSIYVDSSNNVYVTGIFYGTVDFDPGVGVFNLSATGFNQDIFILKLDSNGDFVWAKKLGGSSNEDAYSVTADSSGNVYTTGRFLDIGDMDFDPGAGAYNLTSNSYDVFISKLDVRMLYILRHSIIAFTSSIRLLTLFPYSFFAHRVSNFN